MDWNLNQEVKERLRVTWSLHLINMLNGPWAKPSEPDRTMFSSANYLHETGRQRRATLVHLSISCNDPSMWNLSVGSDTSASPHEQIKPGVFCSAVCLHTAFQGRRSVLEWLFLHSPLFSLAFFLVFPLSPWVFIDSDLSVEAATEEQERCYTLASLCCLTLSYFLLYTFFCSYCAAPPWSLPQLLSQQMWRIWLGKEETPDGALCCFYWLAPCSLCDNSQHSQSSSSTLRFNPSIDCDVKRITKSFWRFSLGDWILFFTVDEGVTLCFSVTTEVNWTRFCEDSVCFFHHCHFFPM